MSGWSDGGGGDGWAATTPRSDVRSCWGHPIGERVLTKTLDAVIDPERLGMIDAVLLSHDQHPDNLDDHDRAHLATAPLVLSTAAAQNRLGGTVHALPN